VWCGRNWWFGARGLVYWMTVRNARYASGLAKRIGEERIRCTPSSASGVFEIGLGIQQYQAGGKGWTAQHKLHTLFLSAMQPGQRECESSHAVMYVWRSLHNLSSYVEQWDGSRIASSIISPTNQSTNFNTRRVLLSSRDKASWARDE